MSTKIIGLVVLLAVGFMIFRPRRKASMDTVHDGHGEHVKDVSPHAGHGAHAKDVSPHAGHGGKVDRGSKKTGGGCCG